MTLALDNPAKPHVKRWTKRQYNEAVDRGAFRGQQIFLYRGELIEMPPMGSAHARGLKRVTDWAYEALRPPYHIRVQSPFEAPGDTMPEPDIGIFTAAQADREPHPDDAVLIVEVSDSSLEIDKEKAFEYAAAGVADYWILDVVNRQLIVHREPIADASAPLGFKYASAEPLTADAQIAPLAKPSVTVSAAEFLTGT